MSLRYQSVQSSLTQQKPGWQDAETLTEFLECVELGERQELCREQRGVQVGSHGALKGPFPHVVEKEILSFLHGMLLVFQQS